MYSNESCWLFNQRETCIPDFTILPRFVALSLILSRYLFVTLLPLLKYRFQFELSRHALDFFVIAHYIQTNVPISFYSSKPKLYLKKKCVWIISVWTDRRKEYMCCCFFKHSLLLGMSKRFQSLSRRMTYCCKTASNTLSGKIWGTTFFTIRLTII